MKKIILSFFLSLWMMACQLPQKEKKIPVEEVATNTVPATKRVYDIEPFLAKADSLQILYYDNPDGDSLRYTRYFTITETADTVQINSLLNEMNQIYVQEPKARSCRSEGKLYMLKGEDILKTIYFSGRGDSCRYFYFIKDGSFVYFPLTKAAATILKENKRKAGKSEVTS